MRQTNFVHLANLTSRDSASFFNDDIAFLINDIKSRRFATKTIGDQFEHVRFFSDLECIRIKKEFENILGTVFKGTQQDCRRQFPTAVNTDKQAIFRIELKVQP